jgi:hypothetical protein
VHRNRSGALPIRLRQPADGRGLRGLARAGLRQSTRDLPGVVSQPQRRRSSRTVHGARRGAFKYSKNPRTFANQLLPTESGGVQTPLREHRFAQVSVGAKSATSSWRRETSARGGWPPGARARGSRPRRRRAGRGAPSACRPRPSPRRSPHQVLIAPRGWASSRAEVVSRELKATRPRRLPLESRGDCAGRNLNSRRGPRPP